MSFRLPRSLDDALRDPAAAGHDAFDTEILAEKAAALGRSGRQVEEALATLSASGAPAGSDEREALLDAAAERFWMFLIQRELCGLRDREQAVRDFGVPREVLNRAGAVKPGR